jgi:hypothetical protein
MVPKKMAYRGPVLTTEVDHLTKLLQQFWRRWKANGYTFPAPEIQVMLMSTDRFMVRQSRNSQKKHLKPPPKVQFASQRAQTSLPAFVFTYSTT